MLNNRVLNRMGARVLEKEEIKRVSAGSFFMLNTPTMTLVGTHEPDFKPDFFRD